MGNATNDGGLLIALHRPSNAADGTEVIKHVPVFTYIPIRVVSRIAKVTLSVQNEGIAIVHSSKTKTMAVVRQSCTTVKTYLITTFSYLNVSLHGGLQIVEFHDTALSLE